MSVPPLYAGFSVGTGVPISPEFLRWLDLVRNDLNANQTSNTAFASTAYECAPLQLAGTSYASKSGAVSGATYSTPMTARAGTVYT